jgi:8-oxo-dGTP pyrophosphatase MutT (NUDIX family)
MPLIKSCGVIVFRRDPLSFLLMRHADRWDLPKGHVDPGETDLECALRELWEETSIRADDVELDPSYCFELQYPVRDKRFPDQVCDKTLRIFLAWLKNKIDIQPTEHLGFEWFPWSPPHQIQSATIDPLLSHVGQHFAAGKLAVGRSTR